MNGFDYGKKRLKPDLKIWFRIEYSIAYIAIQICKWIYSYQLNIKIYSILPLVS